MKKSPILVTSLASMKTTSKNNLPYRSSTYITSQYKVSDLIRIRSYGTTPASPAPATNTPTNDPSAGVPTNTQIPITDGASPAAMGMSSLALDSHPLNRDLTPVSFR